MKSKKFAVRGLIALALVVALCMFFSETIRTIATPKVKITAPRQGKLTQTVTLTGKLTFTESEKVYMPGAKDTPITVKSVKVAAGQVVEAGDLIMEAEVTDFEKTMETLRGQYNTADAQLQTLLRKDVKLSRANQQWADAYAAHTAAKDAEVDAKLAMETLVRVEGAALLADGSAPEGASDALREAVSAYAQSVTALEEAQAQLSAAERYPIDDETRAYITDKIKLVQDVQDAEEAMLALSVLNAQLGSVRAQMNGYITEVNAKSHTAFDSANPAYAICPQETLPVLRADTAGTTLAMAKGMAVTFEGRNNRQLESKILLAGETVEGDKYIDIQLTDELLRDMGGVYAATLRDTQITVEYRAKQSTTLLPASAVRGSGEDSYVYTLRAQQSSFGVSRLVTQKTSVKVLAEADGMVSVEEDLSYQQVAYMEDRAISENTTVMEYTN